MLSELKEYQVASLIQNRLNGNENVRIHSQKLVQNLLQE